MSNKIKWCVIGAGGIADRRTIPGLLLEENSELVAVMDKMPAVAEAVGKKYGVPYFADEEEMLKSVACDAVYISTPVFCHYEQAMLVLKYGRNALLEKPVALSARESRELVDAFKKAGKQLSIGYLMKFHNLHQAAKKMIAEGKIGKVVSIRANFSCWYPEIKGAWRQNKKLGGGGALMDLGVHCIELVEDLLGDEIETVKALTANQVFAYEVEDGAIAVFKTHGGVLGHIDCNFNVPDLASESKLEIYGTEGYIICNGTLSQEEVGTMRYLYAPQGAYDAQQSRTVNEPVTFTGAGENIYTKQIAAFVKILRSGKNDYFYADRAVQVQEVVDKIYADN